MGSAKTALLLTQAYNFEERNMRYLCMKPIIDNRESANVIRSRIGIERACSWIYPEMDLYEYLKGEFERTLEVKAWVLVDEAQFLSKAQVDQLARIVDDYATVCAPTSSRTCLKVRSACLSWPTPSTKSNPHVRVVAKPSSMPESMRMAMW